METNNNKFVHWLNSLPKTVLMNLLSVILLIVVAVVMIVYLNNDNALLVKTNKKINITPTQIESIRNIGQWESLSISNEELIDTVRHGFFGDDQLVRIYYGTLRLGIDFHEADEHFIQPDGDSIQVILPPIKLLDHQFIDEARTKSFYEKGKWTGKDHEAMYYRAYHAMLKRCMTKENVMKAKENATRYVDQFMRSMGYESVKIKWEEA